MKKLFLTILIASLFCINLSAATYTSYCPRWEAGGVVYFQGVQQNVPGAAPSAYCWDVTKIEGYGVYNGVAYTSETLTSSSSVVNWYSGIRTQDLYYMYGENYYGIYVSVAVLGYPQSVPTVKLGSTIGVLTQTTNITSPSGSLLNGKEYRFFIRKIAASKLVDPSTELNVNGSIEVYDGATLKNYATTYIK